MTEPYIHPADVPPIKELSFIETAQSAERLVNLAEMLQGIPAETIIAAGVEITCSCRERERPLIYAPSDDAPNKPAPVRQVEIQLRKFRFIAPDLSLVTYGACGLCPNCQTLYYVHH